MVVAKIQIVMSKMVAMVKLWGSPSRSSNHWIYSPIGAPM